MTIDEIIRQAHSTALEKGWWNPEKSVGELLVLMHSELSETLEEFRNGHTVDEIYYGPDGKPEGVPIELADVIIRICDMCGFFNIDLERALAEKMKYNSNRPWRHGGKTL